MDFKKLTEKAQLTDRRGRMIMQQYLGAAGNLNKQIPMLS